MFYQSLDLSPGLGLSLYLCVSRSVSKSISATQKGSQSSNHLIKQSRQYPEAGRSEVAISLARRVLDFSNNQLADFGALDAERQR